MPPGMRGSRLRQWLRLMCLLFGVLFHANSVLAQPASVESAEVVTQVKAAYLYKLVNYIEWPATSFDSPRSPIRIGVVCASELGKVLKPLVVRRTVNGRSMEVLALQPDDPVAG